MKNKPIFYYLILLALLQVSITGCKKEASDGSNGYNSLITTSIESPGANCSLGGLKIETGLDINRNEALENCEVTKASYLCNSSPNSFAARIDQAGTNAPVTTVIVNSLNLTITWSRISKGRFKGMLNQNLDMSKVILLTNNIDVRCKIQNTNEIILDNACGVNAYCDNFSNFYLEIRVY